MYGEVLAGITIFFVLFCFCKHLFIAFLFCVSVKPRLGFILVATFFFNKVCFCTWIHCVLIFLETLYERVN